MESAHALPPFMLLFLLLLLAIPVYLLLKKKASSEAKFPPGPPQLPLLGNLHQLLAGKNMHRTLFELSKQHGHLFRLKLGGVPALVVSSPAVAKEVLKTHDEDCPNHPPSIPARKLSYGNSDVIFGTYGERWKELRRICIEEFLSSMKVSELKSVVGEEIRRGMRWIASRTEHSPVVNVSELSCFLFISVVCKAAFGRSQYDRARESVRLYGIVKGSQNIFGGFFLGDFFPQLGWVDFLTGMRGKLRRTFHALDSFYQELIREHEELQHRRGNLLDALLHALRKTKNLKEDEIKGLLMNMFLAGTDTSTSLVEWAMTELARHPEAMRKAQDEVRDCVGAGKGKVGEGDLRQLRYLKAVIKETMRLHPPVPLLIPRESVRGFKLCGYDVAPKTTIFINAFAIARDPSSWERPEEFAPERFMDKKYTTSSGSIEMTSHHDFKLLTFGEGRRICPGMNLGVLMTELALANLLYCFDWSLPAGMTVEDIDMGEATGLGVHRSSGLRLVATKYGGEEEPMNLVKQVTST